MTRPNGGPDRLQPTRANAAGSANAPRIPPYFQLILALFIVLTGDFPTVVQAIAFGVDGGATAEFAAAMTVSFLRDLLLVAPIVMLSNHPLGILHPLLLAMVVWPLLIGIPAVIQAFGGWAGVLAGTSVPVPFYVGMPSRNGAFVWTAIAKYDALQVLSLASVYAGFWIFRGRSEVARIRFALPDSRSVRTVCIGIIGVSMGALAVLLYFRGGLTEHLTSLGRGRFRELKDVGPQIVATHIGAIALYLWVAARPMDVKTPLFLAAFGVVMASQFISNGSRAAALTVPLLVGLLWAIRVQRIPWKTALILVPFLFAALGLLSSIRTSVWTGSNAAKAIEGTTLSQSFELAQEELQLRQSLKAQVPIVERGFQVTDGPLLGRTYIPAVLAWVPRTVWPDKPRGPDSLYAQLFLGEGKVGKGIPIGTTVEMYWNFGVPGVLFLSLLFGWLIKAVYNAFRRRYPDPVSVVLYALIITGLRFSTEDIVSFEQSAGLLLICYLAINVFATKNAPVQRPALIQAQQFPRVSHRPL